MEPCSVKLDRTPRFEFMLFTPEAPNPGYTTAGIGENLAPLTIKLAAVWFVMRSGEAVVALA